MNLGHRRDAKQRKYQLKSDFIHKELVLVNSQYYLMVLFLH